MNAAVQDFLKEIVLISRWDPGTASFYATPMARSEILINPSHVSQEELLRALVLPMLRLLGELTEDGLHVAVRASNES